MPLKVKEYTRQIYRQNYFDQESDVETWVVSGINAEDISIARTLILNFQKDQKVNLLKRTEPFVLPAINPQDI